MIFDRIYGHIKQIDILKSAILNERVSHAYIFVGIEGVGKRTVALAFAKALNCLNQKGEGCECCASCKKISHNHHPDIHLVVPERDQIRIDQIRQLQREVAFTLFEGSYRVVIIDQAEKMNPAAANCLLKILEEPPMRTVIVLVCRAVHMLLPTIVSRCQKIVFNPLPQETLTEAITVLGKADGKRAASLAGLSEGSLGRAFELLESPFIEERRTLFRRLLALAKEGISDLFSLSETLAKDKDDFQDTLEVIGTLFRDLLIWRHFQDKKLLMNGDFGEEIAEVAYLFSTEGIVRMMEVIGEAQRQLDRNINTRLLAEMILLEMREIAGGQKDNGFTGGLEKRALRG